MQWLNDFKIAIIEEDIKNLKELIFNMPDFENVEDMKNAFSLINEAKTLIEKKQTDIKHDMNKIQKSKKFLAEETKKGSYEFFF